MHIRHVTPVGFVTHSLRTTKLVEATTMIFTTQVHHELGHTLELS